MGMIVCVLVLVIVDVVVLVRLVDFSACLSFRFRPTCRAFMARTGSSIEARRSLLSRRLPGFPVLYCVRFCFVQVISLSAAAEKSRGLTAYPKLSV